MSKKRNFSKIRDEQDEYFRTLPPLDPDQYRTREDLSQLVTQLLERSLFTNSYCHSLQYQAFATWVLPVANYSKFRYYQKKYGVTTADLFSCAYEHLIHRGVLKEFNLAEPQSFERWIRVASLVAVRNFVKTLQPRGKRRGRQNGQPREQTQEQEYAEHLRAILEKRQNEPLPNDSMEQEEPALPSDADASPQSSSRPLRDAFAWFQRQNPETAYFLAARLTRPQLTYDEIARVFQLSSTPQTLSRRLRSAYSKILKWFYTNGYISVETYSSASQNLRSSRRRAPN